jgi:hypothetical protein
MNSPGTIGRALAECHRLARFFGANHAFFVRAACPARRTLAYFVRPSRLRHEFDGALAVRQRAATRGSLNRTRLSSRAALDTLRCNGRTAQPVFSRFARGRSSRKSDVPDGGARARASQRGFCKARR